jgi:hypothetical protein
MKGVDAAGPRALEGMKVIQSSIDVGEIGGSRHRLSDYEFVVPAAIFLAPQVLEPKFRWILRHDRSCGQVEHVAGSDDRQHVTVPVQEVYSRLPIIVTFSRKTEEEFRLKTDCTLFTGRIDKGDVANVR